MPHTHLVLALSERAVPEAAVAMRRAHAALGASPIPPRITVTTLSGLGRALAGRGASSPHAVLAVLGPDDADALEALSGVLRPTLTPAVALLPDGVEARAAEGVMCARWTTPCAEVAGMVAALAARQGLVAELRDSLRLSQCGAGGLRAQLDRVHEELQIAAGVQREFLPRAVPSREGMEVGVLFRPAGYVSGDIYDVQDLPDGRIGVFLADAVGHGVPAAMLTMVLSRGLRTHEDGADGSRRVVTPSEVLRRLNQEVCRQREGPHRFATALYAVVDPASRTVQLAGAGHPAPIALGPPDSPGTERVETDGPMLGVFPDAEFSEATLELKPGQAMVMFSDGLEAAFAPSAGPRRPRGEAPAHLAHLNRLGAGIARGEQSPGDLVGALSALIDEQSGSLHQEDDVTLVALSFRGMAAGGAAHARAA